MRERMLNNKVREERDEEEVSRKWEVMEGVNCVDNEDRMKAETRNPFRTSALDPARSSSVVRLRKGNKQFAEGFANTKTTNFI